MLWLVRVLAFLAMATSFWLTLQKWLGPRISLAGCGGSEGCATLLDSRWSNWFSIPVTLLAATIWLAVLLLTLPTAGRWLGRTADQLLAAGAMLLVAGGVWFSLLMAAVVKVWCPWCAALHLAAFVVGGLLLHSTWRASRQGEIGLFSAAAQAGVAGLALLGLGQIFGKAPDTHLITGESAATPPIKEQTVAGTVSFLSGTLVFTRQDLPSLGAQDAKHVLASFSDYTCPSCRTQYTDLKTLLRAEPETYAMMVLPTPLDRSCNPHLPANVRDHPGACALARLSLALWKAAPQHFPAFHDFLMTAALPLDATAAQAEAERLAPAAVLKEDDPWIASRIAANIAAWHQLSTGNSKLPKLLLRDDIVLHGSTSSTGRFLEIIKEAFPHPPEAAFSVNIVPR
jgi:uncharacterized membrane protein